MKNNLQKISRSQIELFIECPRCFWLQAKHNIKRPEGIKGGYIGSKYDPLLKAYFDKHRKENKTPEELLKHNLELFPNLNQLKSWRGSGIQFEHPEHKVIYYGKIDDILVREKKFLVPIDFKTTISKEFLIREEYKRQLEIYGYLLKKNNIEVLNIGVLYVIKIDINENFEKIEERTIYFLENLDYDKYDEILENLIKTYRSSNEPEYNPNCEFCQRDFQIRNLSY